MNILFAGTSDFAAVVLAALLRASSDLVGVYTRPDRPSGRGRKLQVSPVKALAESHGIALEQPPSFGDSCVVHRLRAYKPDLMIVVAYGQILPAEVLAIPRLGCVNLHASLLPRWRGAAPIQRALLAGDQETGVCLMQMEPGLDTGPVLARRCCAIAQHDTSATLHDRLAELAGALLVDNLDGLLAGQLVPEAQGEEGMTYAGKLRKDEAPLDWSRPATEIVRAIRAFNPWPVAETHWRGGRLRLWAGVECATIGADDGSAPGTVIALGRDGIRVVCGSGAVLIETVQADGGRAMPASSFLNANDMQVGDQLGPPMAVAKTQEAGV
ncbi:MAG: methionyl-tRNA formyltransferase [Gammaproteobacteria bacterium]|nr:methionyl-tRNA formyltransferase [Gammaproteobacteria bacterium]